MKRASLATVAALLALGACEADQEAFENGATLEPPPAVENAPITDDVGPQRLEDDINAGAPTSVPGASDSLQAVPVTPQPGG